MSEIKSTLDLVMEKTRDLNLSREERDAQRAEDIRKALRGMIQKYRDRVLRKDQFLEEFRELGTTAHQTKEQILRTEILSQIDLDTDPETSAADLELLQQVCGLKVENLAAILGEFSDHRDKAMADRTREVKDQIQMQFQISGSAVVPNVETDVPLTRTLQDLRQTYTHRLEAEKGSLQA
ncbi:MAG: hypothetical protein ACLFUT_06320 [Desulfobacteraceae bacterium]